MRIDSSRLGMTFGCVWAAWAAGCAAPAALQPPAVPAAFQAASPAAGAALDQSFFGAFGNAELSALVADALQHSPDIAAAVARVQQAGAHARQIGAGRLPQVDADLNATQFGGGTRGVTAHETDWSGVLSASYEIDFWGKARAQRASAHALVAASRADLDTARMTLAADVADTFFQIQGLRDRIAIAQLNLKAARDVLDFMTRRHDAGLLGPAEVAAQRAAVANAEVAIPQLDQQENSAVLTLAFLVGVQPEGFTVATHPLQDFAEPSIAAGLPSALLARRPDLAAAEFNLQSAHADVAAARAALFPSLTLTASGGVANPAVNAAVIALAGTGWSVTAGGALAQTLFDNGRRRAATAEAAAHEAELLANYRRAILGALSDVERALADLQQLDAQRQAQQRSVAQSELAFEGAQLRYREGAGEFLAVLEAQRTLYAAREQASLYKLARLQALLSLTKALGGGWQRPAAVPVARVAP